LGGTACWKDGLLNLGVFSKGASGSWANPENLVGTDNQTHQEAVECGMGYVGTP